MSETKFTPGPWVAVDCGTAKCRGGVHVVETADHELQICYAETSGPKNASANAHLIAASPSLYETLKWLNDKGGLGLGVHERIKIVLRKARGEP